jgi:hypothetical protein
VQALRLPFDHLRQLAAARVVGKPATEDRRRALDRGERVLQLVQEGARRAADRGEALLQCPLLQEKASLEDGPRESREGRERVEVLGQVRCVPPPRPEEERSEKRALPRDGNGECRAPPPDLDGVRRKRPPPPLKERLERRRLARKEKGLHLARGSDPLPRCRLAAAHEDLRPLGRQQLLPSRAQVRRRLVEPREGGDPLGTLRQGPPGVEPLSVEEPVDAILDPDPERMEEDRRQRRRDGERDGLRPRSQAPGNRAEGGHRPDEDARHGDGSGRVDEPVPHEDVDVEQAVPRDGDRDEGGENEVEEREADRPDQHPPLQVERELAEEEPRDDEEREREEEEAGLLPGPLRRGAGGLDEEARRSERVARDDARVEGGPDRSANRGRGEERAGSGEDERKKHGRSRQERHGVRERQERPQPPLEPSRRGKREGKVKEERRARKAAEEDDGRDERDGEGRPRRERRLPRVVDGGGEAEEEEEARLGRLPADEEDSDPHREEDEDRQGERGQGRRREVRPGRDGEHEAPSAPFDVQPHGLAGPDRAEPAHEIEAAGERLALESDEEIAGLHPGAVEDVSRHDGRRPEAPLLEDREGAGRAREPGAVGEREEDGQDRDADDEHRRRRGKAEALAPGWRTCRVFAHRATGDHTRRRAAPGGAAIIPPSWTGS